MARDDSFDLSTKSYPSGVTLPVLDNDFYPAGATLELERSSSGTVAVVQCDGSPCFLYRPPTGRAVDSFTYSIVASDGTKSSATVSLRLR